MPLLRPTAARAGVTLKLRDGSSLALPDALVREALQVGGAIAFALSAIAFALSEVECVSRQHCALA